MKRREEFGKRCELCWKNREAHMYPFPVRGKYRRLCKLCWGIIDTPNADVSGGIPYAPNSCSQGGAE